MNSALKPIVKAAVDIGQGVKAAVQKNMSGVITETIEAGQAIAVIAQNVKAVPAELVELVKKPEAASDLLDYAGGLLSAEKKKPVAIIMAFARAAVVGCQLGYGIVAAFQMPDEEAPQA